MTAINKELISFSNLTLLFESWSHNKGKIFIKETKDKTDTFFYHHFRVLQNYGF